MKPSEMKTDEMIEDAARFIDEFGVGVGAFTKELRSRAARLMEEIEELKAAQSLDSPWLASELRTLERINAPSTPIAKDQP